MRGVGESRSEFPEGVGGVFKRIVQEARLDGRPVDDAAEAAHLHGGAHRVVDVVFSRLPLLPRVESVGALHGAVEPLGQFGHLLFRHLVVEDVLGEDLLLLEGEPGAQGRPPARALTAGADGDRMIIPNSGVE